MRETRVDNKFRSSLLYLSAAALFSMFATTASAADVAHGKQVFASCAACHSDRADAMGPDLKGVIGRKSAALEGYRYSGPMRRANLVWDEANLKQYISDPQAKVPGNRMPFSGLHDPHDVDDVIAYLETFK
jgi:cytochrome c